MKNQTSPAGSVSSERLLGDVFAVIIEDRHADTTVEVWTDREAAIERARSLAKEYDRHGDYKEEQIGGWEFYACYSCEGDCTRVVKLKLQSPNAKLSCDEQRKGQPDAR